MEQLDLHRFFDGLENLEAINVANGNQYYKSIDGIVYDKDGREMLYCPRGKSGDLTVPEGVEDIDSGALNSCNKLTTITFSKTLYSFNNYDFTEMASLKAINVPAENESYVSKDGILYGKDYDDNDREYLYHLYCYPPAKSGAYNIPSTVVEISGSTFRNAKKMTSLSIPKSVRCLMDWENLNTMDSLTSVAIAQDSELDYCTVNGIIYNNIS